MKHIEDTPWWICDEGDYNFCAYVDTDSNYFNAEPLLLHLYPDFESKTDEEKDLADRVQDFVREHDYERHEDLWTDRKGGYDVDDEIVKDFTMESPE